MSATEMWQKSTSSMWIYKLKIYKAINGCLIVAIGGTVASLANENWVQMDSQARFLFIMGITLSTLKALDMYLDQGQNDMQKVIQQMQDSHNELKNQIANIQQTKIVTSLQDLQKPTTQPDPSWK